MEGQPDTTLKKLMQEVYPDASFWRGDTLSNDTYHTLKLFYLERGGTDSNLAMKFNLAYVPETGGVKIDQDGKLLSNVTFALYPARREPKGDGTYKYTKTSDEPIGFDTTDEKGQFVLSNADDIAVSLNDLHKRDIKYLILEEQNKNRDGYRHDESIDLVLENKDVQAILLNDENHRWTTGTYAAAKETISTGPYITMPATQDKGGNWKDVCWPVTAEFRKQLNDALIDGYGQAIENLQATLEATKGAAEKPSLTGALKENAGKVKEQPAKPATSKNEQAR